MSYSHTWTRYDDTSQARKTFCIAPDAKPKKRGRGEGEAKRKYECKTYN